MFFILNLVFAHLKKKYIYIYIYIYIALFYFYFSLSFTNFSSFAIYFTKENCQGNISKFLLSSFTFKFFIYYFVYALFKLYFN